MCYFEEKEFAKTYYLMRKKRRYVVFNFDIVVFKKKQCEAKIGKWSLDQSRVYQSSQITVYTYQLKPRF